MCRRPKDDVPCAVPATPRMRFEVDQDNIIRPAPKTLAEAASIWQKIRRAVLGA